MNPRRFSPSWRVLLGIGATTLAAVAVTWRVFAQASAPTPTPAATRPDAIDVAAFTPQGALRRPADLDQWVFLGASLGMGYNAAAFDPQAPGQFQVVLMEPQAYQRLVASGAYPDGAMFLLSFYNSEQKVSINRSGFVPTDLDSFEIHLIDRRRPGEGHYFYPFAVADKEARVLPAGNACISCHLQDGAYMGTFAQFYPAIRHRIPKRALTGGRAPVLRAWI